MNNPLKSQHAFSRLAIPIILGAVFSVGISVSPALGGEWYQNWVNDGITRQDSAKQERSRSEEKQNAGMPGLGLGSWLLTFGSQALGALQEGVGRAFGGETREDALRREKEAALPSGANWQFREKAREDYDKNRQIELDKGKEIAGAGEGAQGLGKEDLDAVAAELGFVDTGKSANKGNKAVEKGNQKAGEAKTGPSSGKASLLDQLRKGVPTASLKQGDIEKLQSACSVPLVLDPKGMRLVCNDSGKGKFNVEPGRKEGQPDGIGGLAVVKGVDCAPNCAAQTGSGTRSAASQSSEKDTKTGPKGPYYLPTGDPKLLVLVNSCKEPTNPAQTDFPASGAWGCVPKDNLTDRDRFRIELDTMEKAIEQLKKTDTAKAAEMEQARKEMVKKALLIPNVEGLPYDAKIKGALMDMLFKSSYEDGERTLKSLEKFKPEIQLCSGCDNTTINITLDQDGKVQKTSLTLPETFSDSGGRAAYSSIETAANLAQSMELVAGVQEGGGTLSTGAELQAQNLRESVVQSGQTVSADQVSTPENASSNGGRGADQAGGAGADKGAAAQAVADRTAPADTVSLEEQRKHQADQREALNDILQARPAEQIKAEQENSREALKKAERDLREAEREINKPRLRKLTDKEYNDTLKAYNDAKKAVDEQKSLQKDLESQMDAQEKKYDKMVDEMIGAFAKRFEERKKKIRENKDKKLTEQQIKDAEDALDNKLKDIKMHPRAYLEAVGKRQSVSASNN